jgi:hypothetical protein
VDLMCGALGVSRAGLCLADTLAQSAQPEAMRSLVIAHQEAYTRLHRSVDTACGGLVDERNDDGTARG